MEAKPVLLKLNPKPSRPDTIYHQQPAVFNAKHELTSHLLQQYEGTAIKNGSTNITETHQHSKSESERVKK